MKQIYRHILAAMLPLLTLTACSEGEDLEPDNGKVSPTFSASIEAGQTRAYDTSWDEGDQIGIFVGETTNDICYKTKAGDGRFEVGDGSTPIVFQDNAKVHFTAYYPYNAKLPTSGTYKGKIAYTSSTSNLPKQSDQKSFDFLWAEADGSKMSPDVKFKFAHKMCKVSLVFKNGDNMDVSQVTGYRTTGFILLGIFDPKTGDCSSYGTKKNLATIDLSNVTVTENKPVTPLILFPQTLNDNSVSLTVLTKTANFDVKLPFKENSIESGKNYQFVIKVSKAEMNVVSSSITDWTDVDLGIIEAS